MWRASVFTLFPEMFPGPLGLSLAGDALDHELWACDVFDIRAQGVGRHRAVDDRPAGGGAGMVMRADVIAAALDAQLSTDDGRPRFYMSPRGQRLEQALVRDLATGPGVVILCGRFEGVDERVIAARGLTELSVGDYVLSGGELGALVLLDTCVRLLPGVMGAAASGHEESFEHGLLEYPHFTRPRDFEGRTIPDVLLGGNHAQIAAWRRSEALRLTKERRPDLLDQVPGSWRKPLSDEPQPNFVGPFEIDRIDGTGLRVRHRAEGHWWRFEVADKNGRLQLVHADHHLEQITPEQAKALAIDAYDTATREARHRGMVD